MLKPSEVGRVLDGCPNVYAELSARDPWRHRANPIVDEKGQLLPLWRDLVNRYYHRFMVGSDPVWPVERLDLAGDHARPFRHGPLQHEAVEAARSPPLPLGHGAAKHGGHS